MYISTGLNSGTVAGIVIGVTLLNIVVSVIIILIVISILYKKKGKYIILLSHYTFNFIYLIYIKNILQFKKQQEESIVILMKLMMLLKIQLEKKFLYNPSILNII